jgi:dihydrofolate reductase
LECFVTTQKLVVRCFTISVDGLAAGPNQSLKQPFGSYTDGFTDWISSTRSFAEMIGLEGGAEGIDNDFVAHAFDNIGATILGRNMFAPSRGPWADDGWQGWWGPNPPYHCPSFVLTNYPRDPIPMEGGTTFHFATGDINDTLEKAFAAAGGKGVRLMGGAATVRQFLNAGLIDELHFVIVPMMIGSGERVFDNTIPLRHYRCIEHLSTPAVTHVRFERHPAANLT